MESDSIDNQQPGHAPLSPAQTIEAFLTPQNPAASRPARSKNPRTAGAGWGKFAIQEDNQSP